MATVSDQFEERAKELLIGELYDARLLVSVEVLAEALRETVAVYLGHQSDPERDKSATAPPPSSTASKATSSTRSADCGSCRRGRT